jgi:acyl carrier protein
MESSAASEKAKLKHELKQLIITECDKEDEFSVDDISDSEALVGSESNLELDSLDTLQISLEIKQRYKVRIEGNKDGRQAFASIEAMADFILSESVSND